MYCYSTQLKYGFPIRGERVTYRGSHVTRRASNQVVHLETATNLYDSGRRTNNFSQSGVVHVFNVRSITKHLITGPMGNIVGLGKQNSLLPLDPITRYFFLPRSIRESYGLHFIANVSPLSSAACHLHTGVGNITFTGER